MKLLRYMTCRMNLAVFVLLFLFFATHAIGQRMVQANEWVFNYPSCPLRLRAGKRYEGLEVKNATKLVIVGYRLGCVARGTGRLIRKPFPFVSVRLRPGEEDMKISTHGNPSREECGNAQVGIVEVAFEDLGVWQLNSDNRPNMP